MILMSFIFITNSKTVKDDNDVPKAAHLPTWLQYVLPHSAYVFKFQSCTCHTLSSQSIGLLHFQNKTIN